MASSSEIAGRSPLFLRVTLGLVYFHFGLLKFFPDLSPAELLATQTVMALSGHLLDAHGALICLALMEIALGIGFIFNLFPRITFALFIFHMCGTFAPLFVLPEFTFKIAPFAFNIEGQYIFKNIVFVAAGWTVLYPHVFRRDSNPAAASEDQSSATSEREAKFIDRLSTPTSASHDETVLV